MFDRFDGAVHLARIIGSSGPGWPSRTVAHGYQLVRVSVYAKVGLCVAEMIWRWLEARQLWSGPPWTGMEVFEPLGEFAERFSNRHGKCTQLTEIGGHVSVHRS
jgi:hypothetical protein